MLNDEMIQAFKDANSIEEQFNLFFEVKRILTKDDEYIKIKCITNDWFIFMLKHEFESMFSYFRHTFKCEKIDVTIPNLEKHLHNNIDEYFGLLITTLNLRECKNYARCHSDLYIAFASIGDKDALDVINSSREEILNEINELQNELNIFADY